MVAAATSLFLALAGASAAHAAATVTVTGDDGNPVAIGATPASIRNMDPTVGIAFPSADGRFSAKVTGPDGTAVASPLDCFGWDSWTRITDFRGNGNYTITITNFAKTDTSCKTPTSTETYVYAINSSVSIAAPPGPFLIRQPNSFTTNQLSLPVQLNPGAGTYEVQYALGAVLNPDGSISGSPQAAYVNSTTNTIDLSLPTPGTYTVVMRAKRGQYASPWSAPVNVVAVAPFDLEGISFPDSRGPSYLVRGIVRDKTLRGTVTLALARGSKGGKYRTIGKATISSKATFSKRFKRKRTGTYRLRVHFAGSPLAPPASIIYKIRITRRIFYR
jgi:hypothetical protein